MAVKTIHHFANKSLPRRVLAPGEFIPPRQEITPPVLEDFTLVDEFANTIVDEFANNIVGPA